MKPVRILHEVVIMDRGGIETMIMNHYRKINREKIQFDFLVHRSEKGEYDDEIKNLGGKIYVLPKFNPFKIYKYKKSLNSFFKKQNKYSIIHSHYNALAMFTLRSAMKNGVSVRIAHSHLAFPKLNHQTPIYWYARRKINLFCTKKFACSENAGSWLFGEKNYNDFSVFKNAICTDKFIFNKDIRKKYRKTLNLDGKFVIGNVGRFHPSKNHSFILKIFKKIYKKNKNSVLLLIGDGNDKQKLINEAKNLEIDHVVFFLGVRSDVSEILQAMDVFLFPSIFEALPVTLIEAQAAGLKTIVSDTITEEVKISDLVEFVSLNKEAEVWAKKVLKYEKGYNRIDASKYILQAGYDVDENTRLLEKFYLNEIKAVSKF